MSRDGCVALPCGAMGLSAVCDCGIPDHTHYFLLWNIFVICVSCHTVLSVPCSIVVACRKRADLLALLYVFGFRSSLSHIHVVS